MTGQRGRPKGAKNKTNLDGRIASRRYAEEATKTLVSVMKDPTAPASARVAAAENILCRAYGRPTQAVELTGADGGPIEHSFLDEAERFSSRIASLVARGAADESAEQPKH